MYKQETIKPYGKTGKKEEIVEAMFDNIAPNYDLLNHRLSWNIDKYWRNHAINALRPYSPKSILDVATGTGDFALLEARKLKPEEIVGADISEGMMAVGRKKAEAAGLSHIISFAKEDCTRLSFPDERFDAVTAAFGIRNFQELDKGLSEMCRVLKKGGHLAVAELTAPVSFPMRQLFRVYSHTFLPAYAKLISHDKAAYEYLQTWERAVNQ